MVGICIEHGFNEEFCGFSKLLDGFGYSDQTLTEGERRRERSWECVTIITYILVILGCSDGDGSVVRNGEDIHLPSQQPLKSKQNCHLAIIRYDGGEVCYRGHHQQCG